MKKILYLSTVLAFVACKKENIQPKDSDKKPLVISSTYDDRNYSSNSTIEQSVIINLRALVNEIKRGRSSANTLSYSTLNGLYSTGVNNIKSITTSYYDPKIPIFLQQIADASGNIYTPTSTITGKGGVYDGASGTSYLFNEYGLEPEQMVEKALFAAALYNHFLTLSKGTVDDATVDKMLCIYGANPKFTNGNSTVTGSDVNVANYAARRTSLDDNNGLYFKIKNDFLKLQSAVKAGSEYEVDKNEAVSSIKLNWEKAIGATCINYCIDATNKLSVASVTSGNMAAALHALSEVAGFIHGFKNISATDKIIRDAQIDEILVLLEAPHNGNAAFYKYQTETFNKVTNDIKSIKDKLTSIYGFTTYEVSGFSNNWLNVQRGR